MGKTLLKLTRFYMFSGRIYTLFNGKHSCKTTLFGHSLLILLEKFVTLHLLVEFTSAVF